MAALSTFAELMARASATVFSQLCTNALEKAAAQQQQQTAAAAAAAAAFSLFPPLLAIAPPPPTTTTIESALQQHQQQQQLPPPPAVVNPFVICGDGISPPPPSLLPVLRTQHQQQLAPAASPLVHQHQQQQQQLAAEQQQLATTKTPARPSAKLATSKEQARSATRKRKRPTKTASATTALVTSPNKKKEVSSSIVVVVRDAAAEQEKEQPTVPMAMEQQKTDGPAALLAVPVTPTVVEHNQPSISPLSTSRISSPDSAGGGNIGHKARKLKLYAAEEKTDIIDYAKCIGNRAAGREFNVAESSIREWRKNEEKIRKQAESTAGCTQHFEKQRPEILAEIDEALVRMVKAKEKRCSSWYGIAERANALWLEKVAAGDKCSGLDGTEMKITMGWIARFMRRNEQKVPKIAPPIIATGSSSTSGSIANDLHPASQHGSGSTRRSTAMANAVIPTPTVETRAKARSRAKANISNQKEQPKQEAVDKKECAADADEANGGDGGRRSGDELNTNGNSLSSSCSRRKRFKPQRVGADCATLLTTSSTTATMML